MSSEGKVEWWVTHHTGIRVFEGGDREACTKLCEALHCPEDFCVTEWLDDEIVEQINAEEFIR